MNWHDHIHTAIREIEPTASPIFDYAWVSTESGPVMQFWNEDRLGPLDLAALQARCEAIATFVPVPATVSPLQMRKALRQLDLKTSVDAYVATLDEEAREEWEYCTEVRRDHAVLNAGAAALGKTDAEVDDLFRLAATF